MDVPALGPSSFQQLVTHHSFAKSWHLLASCQLSCLCGHSLTCLNHDKLDYPEQFKYWVFANQPHISGSGHFSRCSCSCRRMDISIHRLSSIWKVTIGFAFVVGTVDLEGGIRTGTYFFCYSVALKLCVNARFIFILLLNKLKALRIFFVLLCQRGLPRMEKKINVSGLCNCGFFSCVACFIMRKELKIPPRQYLKYQSHCLMPLSHCTTNSIAQCSAVSRYVKHR